MKLTRLIEDIGITAIATVWMSSVPIVGALKLLGSGVVVMITALLSMTIVLVLSPFLLGVTIWRRLKSCS